jgi:hypothetical protein
MVDAIFPVVDSKTPGADRVSTHGIYRANQQFAIVRKQFMDCLRLAVVDAPSEFNQEA